jgi:hypothetical protein
MGTMTIKWQMAGWQSVKQRLTQIQLSHFVLFTKRVWVNYFSGVA